MIRPIVGKKNPVGIDEQRQTHKLSFTPNPVTDGKITVNLPDEWKNETKNDFTVNLISATGKTVLITGLSNPVDVSGLASGLYILVLTNNTTGLKASGKIIIR